jgi:hypothetical protein
MKVAIFALAAALALASCNQGPPPKPIKQLMAEDVQPTAQTYWDAVRFVSDETGDHDIMPRTDAEWEKVRKAAADLGAFGELLKTEAYTEGRAADWTQFAQGLVDVAKLAEQAAVEKNTDKVFEVGGTVYSVCSACHQVYPPAAGPGSPTG